MHQFIQTVCDLDCHVNKDENMPLQQRRPSFLLSIKRISAAIMLSQSPTHGRKNQETHLSHSLHCQIPCVYLRTSISLAVITGARSTVNHVHEPKAALVSQKAVGTPRSRGPSGSKPSAAPAKRRLIPCGIRWLISVQKDREISTDAGAKRTNVGAKRESALNSP